MNQTRSRDSTIECEQFAFLTKLRCKLFDGVVPLSFRSMKMIVRWLLLAAALLLVANVYPGVVVSSFGSAMIAALVLGLLNTLLRPLLVLLTFPVTVLTLGLFLFVINALMFYFAASLLQGFNVTGFGAALIGSLIYSVCGIIIDAAMERLFSRA